MPERFKLSLPAAILINLNIMLGAGIFINSLPLIKLSGFLGAFVYLIIGIIMLPLVLTVARLLKLHPGGSFYTIAAKEINTGTGFFVSWSYFTGKLASSTILIHFFSLIIHQLFPSLKSINAFSLDILIISFFTVLNMLNLKAGMKIQSIFLFLKSIPILFVILTGFLLFNSENIIYDPNMWKGLFSSIPLVIFVFTGFEAACSLSRHIKNPDENAPKVVLISYAFVIFIVCSYQFLFYSLLGPILNNSSNYFEALPYLIGKFPISDLLKYKLASIFQLAIAFSALGGAYGILYSNSWNLYALVEHKHVIFQNLLAKINRFRIPFVCIIVEAIICISYLLITKGNNVQLQQIAALGSTIAYSVSATALLFATFKSNELKKTSWLPMLALFNCLILLIFCIRGLILNGVFPLTIFLFVLIAGLIMYQSTKKSVLT